jgi:hypothetical protein
MDSKEELDNYYKFVQEYLWNITEIELLVLKGHNLIEHSMNRYIADLVMRPEEFHKQNLTFAQKLGIMKFMTVIHLKIFEMLSLFNRVRNELSHNLHADEELIDKFLLQWSYRDDERVKEFYKKNNLLAMKYAIRNICVELNFGRIGAKLSNQVYSQAKLDEFVKRK